ncbi:hypothetical protein ANN_26834 [Periplaneta americana]|uniref:Uncharacterized protein n=1 Tax=Periplaneta americana TaxID=6978 RepID=A0ABQ8RZQ0_PERAM|nr:hypothetical protein ANN_26834 [Periplaneta americana]
MVRRENLISGGDNFAGKRDTVDLVKELWQASLQRCCNNYETTQALHYPHPTPYSDEDAFLLDMVITIHEYKLSNHKVLLPASSLLQISSVREACCKFLMRQLHPSNCLGIRSFAGVKQYSPMGPLNVYPDYLYSS